MGRDVLLTTLVVGGVSTAVTLVLVLPLLRRIAIDAPTARSSHSLPIPRGGGIAVLTGTAAGALAGCSSAATERPYGLGIFILSVALVGLVDDVVGLGAPIRLALVTSASIGLVLGLLNSSDQPPGAWLATIPVAIVLTGYTNAFNFMDGINGIAALHAAGAGAWFAWQARDYDAGVQIVAAGICVSSLVFLPWNAPRARIFLGDVGSYGLGFAIAGLGLTLASLGAPLAICIAPGWIYVVDTGWTIAKRLRRGASITTAHRDHGYQRLVDSGFRHLSVALLVLTFGTSTCFLALLTQDEPIQSSCAFAAIAILYLALPSISSRLVQAAPPRTAEL